jgi:hypothetical protein
MAPNSYSVKADVMEPMEGEDKESEIIDVMVRSI